jgi:hypothetical protein
MSAVEHWVPVEDPETRDEGEMVQEVEMVHGLEVTQRPDGRLSVAAPAVVRAELRELRGVYTAPTPAACAARAAYRRLKATNPQW